MSQSLSFGDAINAWLYSHGGENKSPSELLQALQITANNQDFIKILSQGGVFADRSQAVYELLCNPATTILQAPHGSGKSVLLSMVREIFTHALRPYDGHPSYFKHLAMNKLWRDAQRAESGDDRFGFEELEDFESEEDELDYLDAHPEDDYYLYDEHALFSGPFYVLSFDFEAWISSSQGLISRLRRAIDYKMATWDITFDPQSKTIEEEMVDSVKAGGSIPNEKRPRRTRVVTNADQDRLNEWRERLGHAQIGTPDEVEAVAQLAVRFETLVNGLPDGRVVLLIDHYDAPLFGTYRQRMQAAANNTQLPPPSSGHLLLLFALDEVLFRIDERLRFGCIAGERVDLDYFPKAAQSLVPGTPLLGLTKEELTGSFDSLLRLKFASLLQDYLNKKQQLGTSDEELAWIETQYQHFVSFIASQYYGFTTGGSEHEGRGYFVGMLIEYLTPMLRSITPSASESAAFAQWVVEAQHSDFLDLSPRKFDLLCALNYFALYPWRNEHDGNRGPCVQFMAQGLARRAMSQSLFPEQNFGEYGKAYALAYAQAVAEKEARKEADEREEAARKAHQEALQAELLKAIAEQERRQNQRMGAFNRLRSNGYGAVSDSTMKAMAALAGAMGPKKDEVVVPMTAELKALKLLNDAAVSFAKYLQDRGLVMRCPQSDRFGTKFNSKARTSWFEVPCKEMQREILRLCNIKLFGPHLEEVCALSLGAGNLLCADVEQMLKRVNAHLQILQMDCREALNMDLAAWSLFAMIESNFDLRNHATFVSLDGSEDALGTEDDELDAAGLVALKLELSGKCLEHYLVTIVNVEREDSTVDRLEELLRFKLAKVHHVYTQDASAQSFNVQKYQKLSLVFCRREQKFISAQFIGDSADSDYPAVHNTHHDATVANAGAYHNVDEFAS